VVLKRVVCDNELEAGVENQLECVSVCYQITYSADLQPVYCPSGAGNRSRMQFTTHDGITTRMPLPRCLPCLIQLTNARYAINLFCLQHIAKCTNLEEGIYIDTVQMWCMHFSAKENDKLSGMLITWRKSLFLTTAWIYSLQIITKFFPYKWTWATKMPSC